MIRLEIFFILLVSAIQILTVDGGRQLNEYILHFEELHYDAQEVHNSHMRHKRSIDKNVNVKLDAFNRTFHMELVHSKAGFATDFVLEVGPETLATPDLSFLYTGKIKGVANSKIHGAILEGVFRGSIHLPSESETYHVEKSQPHFEDEKPVFHSIIYKESDMNLDPFKERREKERAEAQARGTCGYTNALKWMKETIDSEVVEVNRAKRSAMDYQEVYEGSHNKYTVDAEEEKAQKRTKRAALGAKNSCFMSLTSDVFFWRYFLKNANNNADLAKDEILAFFASHINAVNKIYGDTNFITYSGDMSYSGVQFTVQKTKVMTETDCSQGQNPLASFCMANMDVSNFLNMNSLLDHDDFCLAYVFTYRDFQYGTLGLAWVGSSTLASGGVCERNKEFTEGASRVKKSLNTGIVTTINYGRVVANKVSQLTFGHEIGHNFGSPHDTGVNCAPYGKNVAGADEGNFIMFASATMGDKPHNSEFSSCSKDNITLVINAILTNKAKYNCFKESGPFCGNGIKEDGEECDCGFYGDCTDSCCIPRNAPNRNEADFCKLSVGANCSPTIGPCCNTECDFVKATDDFTCRYQQECAAEAKCDGSSAVCPASTKVDDGTFCQNFGFTCVNGECAGSLCDNFGWTECFTTGPSKTKAEQEQLCKLGCRGNISGVDTGCVLSDDTDSMVKLNYNAYKTMVEEVIAGRDSKRADKIDGVQLAPGSPCNNFQGYCDVFYRCRGVDAEGPLSRLKNLIFDPQTLEDITNWIQEHWWAVLLMGIGLVLAMGLFIKFCAVHTPSSNPKAKPARKLSETMTLRRRRNQNRQNPQPQPVRYPQNPKDRGYRERDYPGGSRGRDYQGGSRGRDYQGGSRERDYHHERNPQGPPPPYPGSSNAGSHVGPPHGHGKKGKGRKSKDIELGRV